MHPLLSLLTIPLLVAASGPFAIDPTLLQGSPRKVTAQGSMLFVPEVSSSNHVIPLLGRRSRVAERRSRRILRRQLLSTRNTPRTVPPPTPIADPEKRFPNQFYVPTNPLPSLDATSHILMIGEKSPVIGIIKITPQDEPVQVRTVKITLTEEVSSIHSMEVLDEFGFVLGIAGLDLIASSGHDIFTLDLPSDKAYFIDKKDTVIFVVRPILKREDAGGESGEDAEVVSITLTAKGEWSNRDNLVTTSGPDYQPHQTANATIVSVKNALSPVGTFAIGNQKTLGAFTFEARKNSDGEPALVTLSFSLSKPSEVTVSNLKLRGSDVTSTHDCTLSALTVSCSSIPEAIGALDSVRTLTLVGDIAISSHPDPYLQVTLNTPGRPGSAGDISWTDGTTTFTWLPVNPPIADSTLWQ